MFSGVDHAYQTGRIAGRNMAGISDRYRHLPVYEATAPESGIYLTLLGKCSTVYETHGFWWRVGADTVEREATSKESTITSKNLMVNKQVTDSPRSQVGDVISLLQDGFEAYMTSGKSRKKGTTQELSHAAPKGKLGVQRLDMFLLTGIRVLKIDLKRQ